MFCDQCNLVFWSKESKMCYVVPWIEISGFSETKILSDFIPIWKNGIHQKSTFRVRTEYQGNCWYLDMLENYFFLYFVDKLDNVRLISFIFNKVLDPHLITMNVFTTPWMKNSYKDESKWAALYQSLQRTQTWLHVIFFGTY